MLNFKKLYSGFVRIVVIFLVLIAANSLFARFMSTNDVSETAKETQALPDKNSEATPAADLDIDLNTNSEADVDFIVNDDGSDTDQNSATTSALNTEVLPIAYEAQVDDQNAFELLKDSAEIEYKEYDFGVFVESINGIEGDDKHFWAFYLNDEQAQAGADQTILQKGDKVEWRYEEIK